MKESSTQTGEQAKQWRIWTGDFNGFYRDIVITTPTDFSFRLSGLTQLFDLLSACSVRNSYVHLNDQVLHNTEDGMWVVQVSDPWDNPEFNTGDEVASAESLAATLRRYLKDIGVDEQYRY